MLSPKQSAWAQSRPPNSGCATCTRPRSHPAVPLKQTLAPRHVPPRNTHPQFAQPPQLRPPSPQLSGTPASSASSDSSHPPAARIPLSQMSPSTTLAQRKLGVPPSLSLVIPTNERSEREGI